MTEDRNICSASFFMPKRRLHSTYIYMEAFIIKSTYYWDFLAGASNSDYDYTL
jgi:hypothetical protein